ncbi:Hsp70 family protein [Devosia sp. A8/3-2]|nr:Hsp70 family protein [Devosia sp. A8/3-2]
MPRRSGSSKWQVRRQDFTHVEFQFEPIAAALDYERQVTAERLALIVDLGGGTSDFSVVRVSPERARSVDRAGDILSTAGVHVGGTDFDRLLAMAKVMPELGLGSETGDGKRYLPVAPYYDLSTRHRINRLYNAQTLRDLQGTRREARAGQGRDHDRIDRGPAGASAGGGGRGGQDRAVGCAGDAIPVCRARSRWKPSWRSMI